MENLLEHLAQRCGCLISDLRLTEVRRQAIRWVDELPEGLFPAKEVEEARAYLNTSCSSIGLPQQL